MRPGIGEGIFNALRARAPADPFPIAGHRGTIWR